MRSDPASSPARRLALTGDADVVLARHVAMAEARAAGLSVTECDSLGIAVLEVARNAVIHAGGGFVSVRRLSTASHLGVEVVVSDTGPGMDASVATLDGYSTSGGLGQGLPGARRLVSEIDIDSSPGRGSRVRLVQWHGPAPLCG